MHFEPKTFTLKDGRTLVLKNQEPENALEMLEYMRQTSAETENMVRYPEEVEISEEEIQRKKEMLKENQKDKRSLMLGAFLDGKLVGRKPFPQRVDRGWKGVLHAGPPAGA